MPRRNRRKRRGYSRPLIIEAPVEQPSTQKLAHDLVRRGLAGPEILGAVPRGSARQGPESRRGNATAAGDPGVSLDTHSDFHVKRGARGGHGATSDQPETPGVCVSLRGSTERGEKRNAGISSPSDAGSVPLPTPRGMAG